MAQVMYDKAIGFEDKIYTVTQTWRENEIIVEVRPENEKLKNLITTLIREKGQIVLNLKDGYFEIQ